MVEYMKEHNIALGGEPSGHIVFLRQNTTGDGSVAALNVLAVMRSENKKLSELSAAFIFVPQIQRALRIKEKRRLSSVPGYDSLMNNIKKGLNTQGRVYVRYSGTESVVRVLIEGKNKQLIQKYADDIEYFLRDKLNSV